MSAFFLIISLLLPSFFILFFFNRMVGATDPLQADPGSIRGAYCISIGRNIIHASDSFESAEHEIGLWFNPKEVINWKSKYHSFYFHFDFCFNSIQFGY